MTPVHGDLGSPLPLSHVILCAWGLKQRRAFTVLRVGPSPVGIRRVNADPGD